MTMTDPIADMLTRIRNANTAMHDTVKMPSSKLKESLADILEREGYIAGFEVDPSDRRPRQRARDPAQVRARTAPAPSRACAACRKPGPAHLRPGRPDCRASSAGWAWPWSRRARAS